MINWLRKILREQELKQTIDSANKVGEGFYELYCYSLTWHGRYWMAKTLDADNNGYIQMDPKVKVMYTHMLLTAPYTFNATFN